MQSRITLTNPRVVCTGGSSDTRRQRLRHDRQAGPPSCADRTVQKSDVRRGPGLQADVLVPDERVQECQKADEIRRPKGIVLSLDDHNR